MESGRICTHCKEWKTWDNFYFAKRGLNGRHAHCIPCNKAKQADWRARNLEKARATGRAWAEANKARRKATDADWNLRSKYGINMAQLEQIVAGQGGLCANPGCDTELTPTNRQVDHDHKCCPGKKSCGRCIRGVLCFSCNRGLGCFLDDPVRLRGAMEFLAQARKD